MAKFPSLEGGGGTQQQQQQQQQAFLSLQPGDLGGHRGVVGEPPRRTPPEAAEVIQSNDDSFTTLSVIEEDTDSCDSSAKDPPQEDNDSDSAVILESGSDSLKCFGVNPLFDPEGSSSTSLHKSPSASDLSFDSEAAGSTSGGGAVVGKPLVRSVSDVFSKPGQGLKKSVSEGNLLTIVCNDESPFESSFYRGFLLRHQRSRKNKSGWSAGGLVSNRDAHQMDGISNHKSVQRPRDVKNRQRRRTTTIGGNPGA